MSLRISWAQLTLNTCHQIPGNLAISLEKHGAAGDKQGKKNSESDSDPGPTLTKAQNKNEGQLQENKGGFISCMPGFLI